MLSEIINTVHSYIPRLFTAMIQNIICHCCQIIDIAEIFLKAVINMLCRMITFIGFSQSPSQKINTFLYLIVILYARPHLSDYSNDSHYYNENGTLLYSEKTESSDSYYPGSPMHARHSSASSSQ